MSTASRTSRLALVDAGAVERGELPDELRPHRAALETVVAWARDYLCRPHPDLGRTGPVCPFVRASLAAGSFVLTVCPGRPAGPDDVAELLHEHLRWLLDGGPGGDPMLATVLVLFPDLPAADWVAVVDATQRRLKGDHVARGVMIGEFHPGPPDTPGLHNAGFRPLRSPVAMLVLRRMVSTDLAFLESDPAYFAAYRSQFGDRVPSSLRARYGAAADRFATGPDRAGADAAAATAAVTVEGRER